MSTYYIDQESGKHTYYKELDDGDDYTFLLNKSVFEETSDVHIVYQTKNKETQGYSDIFIKYSELSMYLKSHSVIALEGKKDNYLIRVGVLELWVHSDSKVKALEVFSSLTT